MRKRSTSIKVGVVSSFVKPDWSLPAVFYEIEGFSLHSCDITVASNFVGCGIEAKTQIKTENRKKLPHNTDLDYGKL